MSKEIFINVTAQETRVAMVKEGLLQEIFIEFNDKYGIVGNVYVGKVIKILPGMQAAFIDIGLPKAGFLHVSDIQINLDNNILGIDAIPDNKLENIATLLTDGQVLIVQVLKEQIGTKGPRLTTKIALPARYLVYMPGVKFVGVSNKITDVIEVERLRNIVESKSDEIDKIDNGYIIRTAAEGCCENELLRDKEYVQKLWQLLQEKSKKLAHGKILHQELTLPLRVMRDYLTADTDKISIDNIDVYTKCVEFVQEFIGDGRVKDNIILHKNKSNIFDIYNIEKDISHALQRKVMLKSGGYLMFDQTEAMNTIDVNTGSFVGKNDQEETIFKTNIEAALVIARQIKLRNLGGIIIVDFIDMVDEGNRSELIKIFELELSHDRVKNNVNFITDLGIVILTRKRVHESLAHILCEKCYFCSGGGFVKSVETVCAELLRELRRAICISKNNDYLVLAAPEIIGVISKKVISQEFSAIDALQEEFGVVIRLREEAQYRREQFDVVVV